MIVAAFDSFPTNGVSANFTTVDTGTARKFIYLAIEENAGVGGSAAGPVASYNMRRR
jgi:hypothetical protein